jgi:hypothetical protein
MPDIYFIKRLKASFKALTSPVIAARSRDK